MHSPRFRIGVPVMMLVGLIGSAPCRGLAKVVEPITYTVRFPEPARHLVEVEGSFPTGDRASIELMMPIWTPGFNCIEDYARQIRELTARTPGREARTVERAGKNRWTM